jgi:hypothetical protein
MKLLVQPLVHRRGHTLIVAASDADDQGVYWYLSLQDGGSTDVRSCKTREECDKVFLRAINVLDDGGWSLFGGPLTLPTFPPPRASAYAMWARQTLSPIHTMVLAAMMPHAAVGVSI